jgi:hypothetical protein
MTALMYAVGALSLAVAAIPFAFIAWQLTRTSRRDRFIGGFFVLPIAFLVLLVLLIQGFDALGGGELMAAIIYLLAGAGAQ